MSTFTDQGTLLIDTYIENSSENNHGLGGNLDVGESFGFGAYIGRSLLKWDLSSIPSNASITSATLYLYVKTDDASNTRTMRAYRVKRSWVEGNGDGGANTTGPTWSYYEKNGSQAWTTAGCADTTNDREGTDIGSVSVAHDTAVDAEITISLTASAVQEWTSGSFSNNGILLKMDTEDADRWLFYSREDATSTKRPKIVIDYTTPDGGYFFMSV